MTTKPLSLLFRRVQEPNENAFSIAVPAGWLVEGGMVRAHHMAQGVTAQTIEAKVDFALKADPAGAVMIRWCPEVKYCDPRQSPAGMMGMFPPGSNYGGMIVCPLLPAAQFVLQMLFPWAHPQAANGRVVEQKPLPELARKYAQMVVAPLRASASHDAAEVTVEYDEGGVRFREVAVTAVESLGPLTAGMWSNKETHYLRAPAASFDGWRPVFEVIRGSVRLNPQWVAQEQMSQGVLANAFRERQQAEQYRAQRALDTQRWLQQADREIVDHRQRVNAEIRNDAYLNLTNQEEYVNPHTGDIDTGSNQWQRRWVSASGDELYTDDPSYDPNQDGVANRSDWQRSNVRPRFPDRA